MGLSDYKEVYDLLKKAGNVEAQEQIMQLRDTPSIKMRCRSCPND